MFRRKKHVSSPSQEEIVEQEARLVEAESRVTRLFDKAWELHTIATRRDQRNHWQEAVNALFLGRNS